MKSSEHGICGLTLLALFLSACATSGPFVAEEYDGPASDAPPEAAEVYRVFLLGGLGSGPPETAASTLALLEAQLVPLGEESAVVFLGDNRSCCRQPEAAEERRLLQQLEAVRDFEGRVFFLPGDHDWAKGQPGGRSAAARQEAFVEAALDRDDAFLPGAGFPGPVAVDLTDQVTLVVLDTQWWLHAYEKSYGETGEYELEQDEDFLLELDDLVQRHRDRTLLVVGHHPIYSNGRHAGRFPLRAHLFPLTELRRWAYLPLPGIGSLPLLYVQHLGGSRQDLAHPRYRMLRQAMGQIFARHEDLIYVSAHERSLQYFPIEASGGNRQHHLVSGSGAGADHVAAGRGAAFTAGTPGLVALRFYRDGSVWAEMLSPEDRGAAGRVLFRAELNGPRPELESLEVPVAGTAAGPAAYPDYRDSTAVLAANPAYADVGRLHRFVYGRHYRAEWAAPVAVPVLDLGREAGGLSLLRRGGGLQTISLRFQGKDGKQYVVRSVDKDAEKSLPSHLQGTLAADVARDFTSSLHPYGALILPRLSEAAGVYHTNPKIVYVPHDDRLGRYRDAFAGRLMLFEERPDEDLSDEASFGYSENVIGAARLYREVDGDNDHRVDQRAYARARLFDMWIADWDRHEDQWRWASFEPYELDPTLEGAAREQGKIYRPVPRDRDWAFSRFEGVVPSLLKFVLPKFQGFDESYGDLKGLNEKGLRQDRRFTSELERSDWIEIADSLRQALTDAAIEEAVAAWPEPIYALRGAETIRTLKARREKLPHVAEAFYRLQARVVDVVGSHKHERFEVARADDATEVVVYKTTKEGEVQREIYRRTFYRGETAEVRLYGLDGEDQFIVSGEAARGIRVRAVGGPGADRFVDRSRVAGFRGKTFFYDAAEGDTWEVGPETKRHRSDDPAANAYERGGFRYNRTLPLLFLGSNQDDGIFLGGGVHLVRYGFRRTPYAYAHRIKANVATRTGGFNAIYEGHYVSVLGRWDLGLDAGIRSPNSVRNFYGLGNETENTAADARYYQARLGRARLAPSLLRRVGAGVAVQLGPVLEFTRVRFDADRLVVQPQPGIAPDTFGDHGTAGLTGALTLDSRDHSVNPRQGLYWQSGFEVKNRFTGSEGVFGTIHSGLKAYATPRWRPQMTLAVRVGGAHNLGDFPFYEANTLGGSRNLRGYRSTRFAGRTSFYQNAELRAGLLRFSTYVAPGHLGLLAFLDNGRVWADGEHSRRWHQGYGGGVWVLVFDRLAMTGTLARSVEETTFALQMGFQF